jgi:protein SCO1
MPQNKNRLSVTIALLLAVMAFIFGLYLSQHLSAKKTVEVGELHGTVLKKPRAIQPFSLMGMDGTPFNNASLNGSWTMIFFGFTHCGAICPTTMAELGKMYRSLEAEGVVSLPRVVMISVDPDRDDLNTLSHYVSAFDSHFYGARGSDDSIKQLAQEIGIAYLKVSKKDESNADAYDIEHTGTITLFNPQGRLVAFFTTPHHAEDLARDFKILTKAHQLTHEQRN